MSDKSDMDPARRASLIARREALRQNIDREQQLYGLTELRDGLAAAGEEFEILYRGEEPNWALDWVPQGYSRIPWNIVTPVTAIWFGDDEPVGAEAFREALARLAAPDEALLFVFDGRPASFRMTRSVAVRRVDLVLACGMSSLSPLWVTSPPRQWLVEVTDEWVRVGDGHPE